jgi:hypothetical protein
MRNISWLLGISALMLSGNATLAADVSPEVATAAAHAGMAASADDPKMVKAHLHHVLNCLEGPGGADFDAGPGNPCKAMGTGAIPAAAPAARKNLDEAVVLAKEGLQESDLAKAKGKASEAQLALSK